MAALGRGIRHCGLWSVVWRQSVYVISMNGQTPTIVVLREGTDASQGKNQTISNINACLAVQDILRPTLGPLGSDVLVIDAQNKATVSNDGATVLKLLDIVHPAARLIVDVARSQDAEVGDGTTTTTILAGELLKEAKLFVDDNVPVQWIVKGYRLALLEATKYIKSIAVDVDPLENGGEMLKRVALTAMSSKLVATNGGFFAKMVVDAVLTVFSDPKSPTRALKPVMDDRLVGLKKVVGGGLEDSLLISGVAFKKTFSYAGFEQQPKKLVNPKIACLEVELELKAEKDNAEVRLTDVSEYQRVVDSEWRIITQKLDEIVSSGCNIVLSQLPIGDLATQYFADRNVFCAGRVAPDDMFRVLNACDAKLLSTTSGLQPEDLGQCTLFEEKQIGGERFNVFLNDKASVNTATLILRGGSEQFLAEIDRSLHDAIMVVKRAVKAKSVVAGGGAAEMAVSKHLRDFSKGIHGRQQLVVAAFARALEVVPRQLCENAGFDAVDMLNLLRMKHFNGETWAGVDFTTESVANNYDKFVWEPSLVKVNALESATEAACVILSVDETIVNKETQGPPM